MAGNTKEIPTTTIKTNGEYNGNWNISDRTLGMLPKGVDTLTKSCAAEHTASSQFRSCSDLDSVNQWISQFEPSGFREFLGSGQAGYRFSTGSIDAALLCSSSQDVGQSVNGVNDSLASNLFYSNNADRSRFSSVSDIQTIPVSGQSNGVPYALGDSGGTVPKRRKSSFQITSITAPDRSKLSSAESNSLLDSWDSYEDMLSVADDTGSDTQDTSHSTIDFNDNPAMSLNASPFFPLNTDAAKFVFDNASCGILNIGSVERSSEISTSKSVLPGTDKSKDPHLSAPSIASSNQITDASKVFDSMSDLSKPMCPISEIHSRFKIVKILNRVRGRWKCTDYIGLPMSIAECASPKLSEIIGTETASDSKQIFRANDATHCDNDRVNPIPFVFPQESSLMHHPTESIFPASYALSTLQGIETRLQAGCDEIKLFQSNQSNFANSASSGTSASYVLGLVPLSHEADLAQEESLKSNDIVVLIPQRNHDEDPTTSSPSIVAVSSCAFSNDAIETTEDKLETDECFATCSDVSTRPKSAGTAIESAIVKSAGTFELDNKIEQAMDLVKTHLMFAVHEEVELLKLKINELMTKNSRLEHENNILRVSADPQLLSNLDSQFPLALPRTGPS